MEVKGKKTEHRRTVRCLSRMYTVIEMAWVVVNLAWLVLIVKEYFNSKNACLVVEKMIKEN